MKTVIIYASTHHENTKKVVQVFGTGVEFCQGQPSDGKGRIFYCYGGKSPEELF